MPVLSEEEAPAIDVGAIDNVIFIGGRGTRFVDPKLARLHVVKQVQGLDERFAGLPIISGIGSSNLMDHDKDVFHPKALMSMRDSMEPGFSTWRNHSFRIPDDYIGALVDWPEISLGTVKKDSVSEARSPEDANFSWIRLTSSVEMENPPAARTFKFITRGAQFGWSVGIYYTDLARRVNRSRGVVTGFDVFGTKAIEASVVALPSNPAAFIDIARKSLIKKGVIVPNESDTSQENLYRLTNMRDFDERSQVLVQRFLQAAQREGLLEQIDQRRFHPVMEGVSHAA